MSEYIVVDGYNVVYAWPDLKKLKEESLEHARDRLVHTLADYAGLSGDRIMVVFDAHQVRCSTNARYEEVNGVQIFYTREEETADAMIERLVGEMPGDGYTRVVTSDWDEQRIILGRGAYRMTPGELRQRVLRIKKEGQDKFTRKKPADGYLENRLAENIRQLFEQWRKERE
ncbi:MAG: NYN domain-containing protein [Firmicutes bacterium]|nr:NYN domain-containing protein [Bacillota bacterium]